MVEVQGLSGHGRGLRFGVIGSPIQHSLSPLLHRTAYRELGIGYAGYETFEVPAGTLAAFWEHGPGARLDGASITMPGKPEALALATEADAVSQRLGIANTLLRLPGGGSRAENHDVHGITRALREQGAGAAGPIGEGAVLGSGATALSATAALLELGVRTVVLSARRPDRLAPLQDLVADAGARAVLVPWEQSHRILGSPVVVSALALEGALSLAGEWATHSDLPTPGIFLDVLYEPWPAPLAGLLGERGASVVSGLEMLLHQADMQLRSMLGIDAAPLDAMRDAARHELARRTHQA